MCAESLVSAVAKTLISAFVGGYRHSGRRYRRI